MLGFSDKDSGDELFIDSLTPYLADSNGDPTDILAGSITPLTNNAGEIISYQFIPNDDVNGEVYLQYTVSDGNGPGVKTHIPFTINEVQDIPKLGKLEGSGLFLRSIDEDTVLNITETDLLQSYGEAESYVADPGITSTATGLSGSLQGSGTSYALVTTSISKIDAAGVTTNPALISGLSIQANGQLSFDSSHDDYRFNCWSRNYNICL